MESFEEIISLLPGTDCSACGCSTCYAFACKLRRGQVELSGCKELEKGQYNGNKRKIEAIINKGFIPKKDKILGLIDQKEADFVLTPLAGEPSCRETLASFSTVHVKKGMLIKYRPLGCPITHFSRVITLENGLMDVWEEKPCEQFNENETPVELGICLILSFQGKIKGPLPNIGQTVKFIPDNCMMGKIHSGIVVMIDDGNVRIDCIDLKVWQHAPQVFQQK